MNRGTKEGTQEEIYFCEKFNREEINLENTNLKYSPNTFAVHSVKHQYSYLSEKYVKPKSDCFLIKDLKNNFKKKDTVYISELDLENGTFEYVKHSGISVKNKLSKKYQIHKFGLNTFNKVFLDKKLFIGVIIYCQNDKELYKNNKIFEYAEVDKNEFLSSFQNYFDNYESEKKKLKKIKTECIKNLKTIIENDQKIWDIIFTGKECFEDPFYSSYFYQNDSIFKINNNYFSNFSITNGSGRSNNNYTVVIKPCIK